MDAIALVRDDAHAVRLEAVPPQPTLEDGLPTVVGRRPLALPGTHWRPGKGRRCLTPRGGSLEFRPSAVRDVNVGRDTSAARPVARRRACAASTLRSRTPRRTASCPLSPHPAGGSSVVGVAVSRPSGGGVFSTWSEGYRSALLRGRSLRRMRYGPIITPRNSFRRSATSPRRSARNFL